MPDEFCRLCKGTGRLKMSDILPHHPFILDFDMIGCPACDGRGKTGDEPMDRKKVEERDLVHQLKEPLATIVLPAELMLRDLAEIHEGKASFEHRLPDMENRLRDIIHQTMEAALRIDEVTRFSEPEIED